MTYRKEIVIDHKHSLDEWEIIEVLNALISQAAFAKAWKAHCQGVTGVNPDEMQKLIKQISNLIEDDDLIFLELNDLKDMICNGYPLTYENNVAAFSPYCFLPLSTPTFNNQ